MTAEQENLLRRHYADTRTDRLAAALGVSYRTVCRWAANLGLKKTREYRSEQLRRPRKNRKSQNSNDQT